MEKSYEYEWRHFPNIGFVQAHLSDRDVLPIKEEIKDILKGNNLEQANKSLYGHIKKEYKISKNLGHIEKIVLPYIFAYLHEFGPKTYRMTNIEYKDDLVEKISKDIYIDQAWVNIQQKHEFNPVHMHKGIFSFVIWVSIPYGNEEKEVFKTLSGQSLNGEFVFHYINAIGTLESFVVECDKSKNNKLIVFPSELNHSVYPFYTTDDYRISVSGNFCCK